MAINKIFASTEADHRARKVDAGTKSGDALLVNGRPAVALTDRGDGTAVRTTNLPAGVSSITYATGGASLAADEASLAFDGTFEFEVTGATTATDNDVKVYITSAKVLTLTVGSNTLYGYTDYPVSYKKVAGRAPVRIGA